MVNKEPNIKKEYVKPFRMTAYCPECGEKLESSDICLCTYPQQYIYNCPKCNYTHTTHSCLTGIVYEPAQNDNQQEYSIGDFARLVQKTFSILDEAEDTDFDDEYDILMESFTEHKHIVMEMLPKFINL